MDLKRINILLERYWNCVSTVAEEEELKAFFNSNEVPAELQDSAALFRYFEQQKQARLDEKFAAEVLAKIKEQKAPVVSKISQPWQNYLRVAAVVLVIITSSLVFRMEFWEGEEAPTLLVEDTYKTPEEAYAETKKAFLLIAEKLNSGRKQAERISILSEAENKVRRKKKQR